MTRDAPAVRRSALSSPGPSLALLATLFLTVAIPARSLDVEILQSVGGLPAHVAGSFDDLPSCQQTPSGEYFVFDRRAHAVFSVAAPQNEPRKLVQIGAEPGRVLRPYAFDSGPDGTFIIADAPDNHGRVQVFTTSGAGLGGFTLATRDIPMIILEDLDRQRDHVDRVHRPIDPAQSAGVRRAGHGVRPRFAGGADFRGSSRNRS